MRGTKVFTAVNNALLWGLFFTLWGLPSQSVGENYVVCTREYDTPPDSLQQETNNMLLLDLNYSTQNTNIDVEDSPSFMSSLYYTSASGFTAQTSVTTYRLSSPLTYEYDLAVGYEKYFDCGIDLGFSVGLHGFVGDTEMRGIDYSKMINANIGYDFGVFDISTDFSSLIGESRNLFVDFSISKYIGFEKLFLKNDNLSFSPTLSLSFGTDRWVFEDLSTPQKRLLERRLTADRIGYNNFSVTSTDVMLPVSYDIGNLSFSALWMYSFMSEKYKSLGMENRSSLVFSVSYMFNF